MKINQRVRVFGVAALLCLAVVTKAEQIEGEITFSGGATLNSTLGSATSITAFFGPLGVDNPVVNGGATGGFAGVPAGTPAVFTPFALNASSIIPLWSLTNGSTVFRFEADAITSVFQDADFLTIQGSGTAFVTGFDPTPGPWSITGTGVGTVITFGAFTLVPEPSVATLAAAGAFLFFAFRNRRKLKTT